MDEDDTNVEPMFDYHGFDEGYNIDSLEDIVMIEFWNIRDEYVCHFHFSDVNITFEFYNRYARPRGFSARKNRTRKSRASVLKLKNFVCHREGFRPQNNNGIGNFKKKPTPETRCGYSAMMEIRLDAPSDRWFISYFSDEHSHPLLDPRLTGLFRGHRFMSEADIGHMINMEKGEISVGQIYRTLAN
ncbi:protein FAR1-RELATED SEQUENCE 11-like [Arachis ipaensis]|uniref:protein FAR1-RELATED SEQUENCE 11-like n=1 Tax=Arachis ipaensis TaxID=130454 RepID=UPI000A2B4867|nr:protein FAR1-RELATED SEQUENCE 11-like [Arachis ipaensis]